MAQARVCDTTAERLKGSSSLHPHCGSHSPTLIRTHAIVRYAWNDGELADCFRHRTPHCSAMSTAKAYSILRRKTTRLQHMLALCSIYWQGNQDDGEEVRRNYARSTRCHDMLDIADLLPRYAVRRCRVCLLSLGL